jgi:prolyl 4-hydroxylase
MEGATVLHYDVGEQITNHYDFIDPSIPDYDQEVRTRGERIMTFLAYLNDDYEGGETEFPRLGVRHKGRRGEGLYFINALPDGKPDRRSWHAGRPPVRGEKWILSQFIRNRRVLDLQ